MKRFVLGSLLLSAVGFVACDNVLTGDLEVSRPLPIKIKSAMTLVQPGKYPSTVKIGKDQIEFQVTTNGQNLKWKMNIPAGSQITPEHGKVFIKGSDMDQAFDFMAGVETQTESSGPVQSVESCTYSTTEYGCWNEGRTVCDRNFSMNSASFRILASDCKPGFDCPGDDGSGGGGGDDHGGGGGGGCKPGFNCPGDGDSGGGSHGGGSHGGGDDNDHGGGGGSHGGGGGGSHGGGDDNDHGGGHGGGGHGGGDDNDHGGGHGGHGGGGNDHEPRCHTEYEQVCGNHAVYHSGSRQVVSHTQSTFTRSYAYFLNPTDGVNMAQTVVIGKVNVSTVNDSYGSCY